MAVKIGTTIAGTYQDGPGFPNQSHLVYAISAGVWWYFTLSSAADLTGIPGTHTVAAYVSSGPNLATATWSFVSSSPNLAMPANSNNASQNTGAFRNGRSLAVTYWNNSTGANQDIVHVVAGLYPPATIITNGVVGNLRAVLTSTTITWGTWGYWYPSSYTYTDTGLLSGLAVQRGSDGRIHTTGSILTDQLDLGAVASNDADVADTWTTGGNGTGTCASAGSTITALSNETGMAVGYGIQPSATPSNAAKVTPQITSIDSGTQITAAGMTWSGAVGGQAVGWTNFSSKTRNNLIADSGITTEVAVTAIAPLASGAMLVVYNNGAVAPPNMTNLSYTKGGGTAAAGVWPNNGAAGGTCFAATVTIDDQDWCLIPVSLSQVYVARRGTTTQVNVAVYAPASDSFSLTTNQPPATSGTIKAGGGVVGASDGVNFWVFVIDGTNNNILSCQYTIATGTWGAWTVVEALDSTGTRLSGHLVVNGGSQVAGLVYAVTNGSSFDTYVTQAPAGSSPVDASAFDSFPRALLRH